VITKISLSQPVIKKPEKVNLNQQNVSFGAKDAEGKKNGSGVKKAAILAAAAVVLAVPIILAKAPVGKIKVLGNLQTKLKTFLQQTVKPFLDKVMGKTVSADAGINVIR
jgi:hypothetical protein